jgi:hypothetical protein
MHKFFTFSVQKIPKTQGEHFEEYVLVTEEVISCSK